MDTNRIDNTYQELLRLSVSFTAITLSAYVVGGRQFKTSTVAFQLATVVAVMLFDRATNGPNDDMFFEREWTDQASSPKKRPESGAKAVELLRCALYKAGLFAGGMLLLHEAQLLLLARGA